MFIFRTTFKILNKTLKNSTPNDVEKEAMKFTCSTLVLLLLCLQSNYDYY